MDFRRRLVNAHSTVNNGFLEFYRNGDVLRIKYPFISLIRFIRPITIESNRAFVLSEISHLVLPSKAGLAFCIFLKTYIKLQTLQGLENVNIPAIFWLIIIFELFPTTFRCFRPLFHWPKPL